jgi:hypothetical protein
MALKGMRVLALCLWLLCGFVHGKSVGILYEVWHTGAARLMKQLQQKGLPQLTVEQVIRSDGKLTLDDVYVKHGLPNGDIYNVQPELGFYCLYRSRSSNDTSQDCDNISHVAEMHAKMLLGANIDYISVDVTNWPIANAGTDLAVIRPTEVLFEEWLALRKRGIPTPQISVWPCSPASTGSNPSTSTWKALLESLYNKPEYDELVYKIDGKKVVFLPKNSNCYDVTVEKMIRSNGGRNDVVTIPMWAQFPQEDFAKGVWGFFSMCVSSRTRGYTSTIVGEDNCNQPVSYFNGDSSRKAVSVSPSYQSNWASLPGGAAGKFRGLTLFQQFQKVFEVEPEFVFVSSFNEHIGGRQKGISSGNMWFDQGLPYDSQNKLLWVDTYATEFSRDVEPSLEGGDRIFRMLGSCLSLYKQSKNCSQGSSELCCQSQEFDVFRNVWSLRLANSADSLLTVDENEKNALTKSGNWKEVCWPTGGPSVFCVDMGSSFDGRAGSFILYSKPVNDVAVDALYRCITPQARHFPSLDANCEQLGKAESLLGYVSRVKRSETSRRLTRCMRKSGTYEVFKHVLELNCDQGEESKMMGWVH